MANSICIAGSDSKYQLPDARPAGFCAGLWHAVIAPVTFVVSLRNPGVGIYEANNNGRWYNFGFVALAIAVYMPEDWELFSYVALAGAAMLMIAWQ